MLSPSGEVGIHSQAILISRSVRVYSILTTRWRYLLVKGKGSAIQVVS